MYKKILLALLPAILLFSFLPSAVSSQTPETNDRAVFQDIPPRAPESGSFIYTPRPLTEIVIHHSGSFPYNDTPGANASAVASYRNYHKYSVHPGVYSDPSTWAWYFDYYLSEYVQMPAQEGFPDGVSGPAGYNYNDLDYQKLVGTDGLIYEGRRIDTVGWHASNWDVNVRSIGVCFIGCFDAVAPSEKQYWAGVDLVSKLMMQYHIYNLSRHSDYAAKSCPGYSFPWNKFVKDCRQWAGIWPDANYDFWAHQAIASLGQRGLISGFPDGLLKPVANMTRAEFITLLWRASGSPIESGYMFVDTQNHWAKNAIAWGVNGGLIDGYPDGLFLPDRPITRGEMAKIIFNFKKPVPVLNGSFSDVPSDYWAKIFISSDAKAGFLTGYPDGTFRPDNYLNRSEAFFIIYEICP